MNRTVLLHTDHGPIYADTDDRGRVTAIYVPAGNRALLRAIRLRQIQSSRFLRQYRGLP